MFGWHYALQDTLAITVYGLEAVEHDAVAPIKTQASETAVSKMAYHHVTSVSGHDGMHDVAAPPLSSTPRYSMLLDTQIMQQMTARRQSDEEALHRAFGVLIVIGDKPHELADAVAPT
jgi:hypothetical protein